MPVDALKKCKIQFRTVGKPWHSRYFSRMNRWLCFFIVSFVFFTACTGRKNTPDVSAIQVNVTVKRFERDFFAIDTTNVESSLTQLQQQYGPFLNDFLYNILSLPSAPDTVVNNVKLFLHTYRPIYDSVEKAFPTFSKQEKEIKNSLQFVGYYFPKYELPKQIITFVGPFEGYSNVLTGSGVAVGLQLYLGKNFSAYQTDFLRDVYPLYQSRRFETPYIPVNSITNIINDIYPPKPGTAALIDQMVEEGKRMYVLDKLMPNTEDTLKTGYTANQLKGAYNNEAAIWNYFIENNLLYITNPSETRDYTNDAPRTEALGPDSPGNIGLFVGWQIVKKWMREKGDAVTLPQLLQTDAKQIFQEAKYKPR